MKTKILTVFLITLTVVGLSWIYLNRLSSVSKGSMNEFVVLNENTQTITPRVNVNNTIRKRHNIKVSNVSQPMVASLSIGGFKGGVTADYLNSSSLTISSKNSNFDNNYNNSSSARLIALASGNSNSQVSAINGNLNDGSLKNIMLAGTGNSSNNEQILIDPGAFDPDERTQIPVGNGTLLLLLMSTLYGVYLFRMKK